MPRSVAIALGRTEETALRANAYAARTLLRNGTVAHIIFSGLCSWLLPETPPFSEAEQMLQKAMPLPPDSYSIENLSTATVTNLTRSKTIAVAGGWDEIVLVCIPFAQWRANYLARKVFGPGYKIRAVTSRYNFERKWRILLTTIAGELYMLRHTWKGIHRIPAGDDAAVLTWWESWQAAYGPRHKKG